MLTDLEKGAAQATVNVFETGTALGHYGQVTLLANDPGHLTYGRAQTTLASGNLYLLIRAYCAEAGATHAAALAPYLPRLEDLDLGLDHDANLRGALKEAGDDPVMQRAQDAFFDRVYWAPAVRSAEALGIASPLGTAIVYDGHIHGSWQRLSDACTAARGAPAALGEQACERAYVETRRAWLEQHSNALLRKTAYRMHAFQGILSSGNWLLALPFAVRGATIDEAVLAGGVVRASADVAEVRSLRLRQPFLQGEDVRAVQRALTSAGVAVETDGVFGTATHGAVQAFQRREGMTADGIVGPATRSRLGLLASAVQHRFRQHDVYALVHVHELAHAEVRRQAA